MRRVHGVGSPPEMSCSFLIQLVFCIKKNYVVFGVETEHETRLKNIHVKRRKNGSLARHVTPFLSVATPRLQRKFLGPPLKDLIRSWN